MTDSEQSGTAEPRPAIQRVSGLDEAVDPESEPATEPVHSSVDAVLADVRDYFAGEGSEPFGEPTGGFVEEAFFDFSYLERYEEVERRWVTEPFAYVSILYDPERNEYSYRVVEPTLDRFEQYVRADLITLLRNELIYMDFEPGNREAAFIAEASDLIDEHAATVDPGTLHKVLYYLRRDFLGYGPIDPIMNDPAIEDISCDGSDVPVYVYHREFRDLPSNVSFSARKLNSFVVQLAQRLTVEVRDRYNNPVSGAEVSFSTSGGDSVPSGPVTSDEDGRTSVPFTPGDVDTTTGRTVVATIPGGGEERRVTFEVAVRDAEGGGSDDDDGPETINRGDAGVYYTSASVGGGNNKDEFTVAFTSRGGDYELREARVSFVASENVINRVQGLTWAENPANSSEQITMDDTGFDVADDFEPIDSGVVIGDSDSETFVFDFNGNFQGGASRQELFVFSGIFEGPDGQDRFQTFFIGPTQTTGDEDGDG